MAHENLLTCDILGWLARLPFLAVDDLALLTGQPAQDIAAVLREMDRDGHVDWVTPSSPELDTDRLYVLTETARQHVASDGRWITAGKAALPVSTGDVVHRLSRLEATVALNAFAVNLVASWRRAVDMELQDIWSLPVRRPANAWWPPGVEAFGWFQSGEQAAPFFVFVDRAGTPAVHRGALVAGWHQFGDRKQPWGRDNVPPILTLCPDTVRETAWARRLQHSADRRGVPVIKVVLADRSVLVDSPNAPIWQSAHGPTRTALAKQLTWWRSSAPRSTGRAAIGLPATLQQPEIRLRLHAWAKATAAGGSRISERERVAALALTTGSLEKRLIDSLGRHPLLTAIELGTVLGIAPRIARQTVERALQHGLIVRPGATGDPEPRYCLAMLAVQVLAARDGVPLRRYAQHAPITAMPRDSSNGLPTLLQQREHTVGANSLFLGMLSRPTEHCRLARWEGATEAVTVFELGGERRTVRPDGAGIVVCEGKAYRFFLEWDRGTERIAILLEKFARYANYYLVHPKTGQPLPTLLVACPSSQREDVVWRAATTVFASESSCQHLLTTTHPHLDLHGPFGTVWRGYGRKERRQWLGGL